MSNRRKRKKKAQRRASSAGSNPIASAPVERELIFTSRLMEMLDYRSRYFEFAKRYIARGILGDRTEVLSGESATLAMKDATEAAITLAAGIANSRDAFYWLERLRRVPLGMFGAGGELKLDSYYEGQVITEIVSALTTRKPQRTLSPSSDPLYDDIESVQELTRLLALGSLARHYKVMWRCAAKTVPIILSPNALAVPDKTSDAWAAVKLYDSRISSDEAFNLTLGTLAPRKPYRSMRPRSASDLVGLRRSQETDIADHVTFTPWMQHSPLPELLHGYDWYKSDLPLLIFLNQVLLYPYMSAPPEERKAIERLGYSGWKKKDLEQLLLSETQSKAWRTELADHFTGFEPDRDLTVAGTLAWLSGQGSVMPLRAGPVLRPIDAESICIDHAALDVLLQSAIGPKQGRDEEAKNTRAADFEIRVQELIDGSGWAPPEDVRRLVGSKPKDGAGTTITDLDAIAARGDTCLLIDCKSFLPELLGEGDFRATRNAATALESAIAAWRIRAARVLKDAVDPRYDVLRAYRELTPVVVTPGVYFLPLGAANDFSKPGLRAISSILELVSFMQSAPR